MPVITKIVRQKKRQDRYSIFLEDEYAFSVAEDVLIAFQLQKGRDLSKVEIDNISEKDAYSRTYAAALNYLSYRMRSVQEMETYLRKKEIPSLWLEQIIVKLLDNQLLDDTAFAKAYVRDRIHQSTKGPKILEQELSQKGIDKQVAKEATQQFTFEDQYDNALKWLKKERRKKVKHAHKKQEAQHKVKLAQKGFNQEVIQMVFKENPPVYDADDESVIFQKEADKLHRKHSRKWEGFELTMKLKTALFQRGFQAEMIDTYITQLKEIDRGEHDEI